MPYYPNTTKPWVEIITKTWADGVDVTLVVNDFSRLMEDILSIKGSSPKDSVEFTVFSQGKETTIRIVNGEKKLRKLKVAK